MDILFIFSMIMSLITMVLFLNHEKVPRWVIYSFCGVAMSSSVLYLAFSIFGF